MSPMPPILVYHRNAAIYDRLLRAALPGVELFATTDPAELEARIGGAEILVCMELTPAQARMATSLRWIQATSSGVDRLLEVRQEIAHAVLTNARGIHADLMSEYVMAGMMMARWDFPALLREQAGRRWARSPRRSLAGATVAVVGLGPVGLETARRAAVFGMNVIGVTRSGRPVDGVGRVIAASRLREALPDCDFLALAVPTTDDTRGMVGAAEIAAMKPGAVVVNISRGSVIDEPAMIAALQDGRLGGAVLDVFVEEPLPQASPLWGMPNVIVTPHISGMTEDNEERFLDLFLDNLRRYRAGEPLVNTIDLQRGY